MAPAGAGISLGYESEHRSNGKLVVRMVSIPPPAPLTCPSFKCYLRYVGRVIRYGFILGYHKRRVAYCEQHRYEDIPEHYRTGDPSPVTVREAVREIIKLSLRR